MTSKLKAWPIFTFLQPEFISKIRMVLVFGNLNNSCIIVTTNHMVYGLGDNTGGCLGIGTNENSTTYPKPIPELNEKDIKTLTYCTESGQNSYVAALTKNGKIYAWGQSDSFISSKPMELTEIKNVVDIVCGMHYSLALTENGLLYRWHHQSSKVIFKLQEFGDDYINTKIVGISSGHLFSMVVTESGNTYMWGAIDTKSRRYQIPSRSHSPAFKEWKLKPLSGVIIEKVVCGYHHSLALSIDGYIYSLGCNYFGQLGFSGAEATSWQSVQIKQKILDIAASPRCSISVAMAIDYKIYMWGECLSQRFVVPILIPNLSIHDVFAYYALPSIMHQQLVINNKEEEYCEDTSEPVDLLEHLRVAFDDSATSDLTIEVLEKPIYVHKAILKIRSKYFAAMFKTWLEKDESVIKVCEFSYDVYRAFLKFLYTNEFHLPIEDVGELLKLADCYGDENLKTACEFLLTRNLSPTQVIPTYVQATQYNATTLRTNCVKFAANFMSEIVGSPIWQQLSSDLFKQFIIEANKTNKVFIS
ncbi:RCC1 and BTB domain-containing protein 1 [Megalopta genalis]|uniref:RCC1 and BTB domain-containing protein 1 n=1 Tax=Megalopta genalis TaxID=115081 RepID=UPI003FD2E930